MRGNRKYIIFGSSGFIGSHFIAYLKEHCLGDITTFDIKDNESQDVRKPIFIDQSFSSHDIIINLAAIHKTPGHKEEEYFNTNIFGADNVCKFAEEKGINNILFISSIASYGASEEQKMEESLLMPNTAYGISKVIAEKKHQIWQSLDSKDRRLLILRPGVVFGKGEGGNFTRLFNAIKRGVFFYPGRKDTMKSCIYVKDLVYASLELLKHNTLNSEVCNFCYHKPSRIDYIARVIANVVSSKEPKLKINGKLLILAATIVGLLGGRKIGIHPDRVKKLMTSTNISGSKLYNIINLPFGLEEGVQDWFSDCNGDGLF